MERVWVKCRYWTVAIGWRGWGGVLPAVRGNGGGERRA